jgi:hypothetical protein
MSVKRELLKTGFLFIAVLSIRIPLIGADFLQMPDHLRLQALGTGETTGEVVDLRIVNSGTKSARFTLGPLLIPSADSTQGYCIPEAYRLELPAGTSRSISLRGYCTNPYLPPARKGGSLAPLTKWVQVEPEDLLNLHRIPMGAAFIPIPADFVDTLWLRFPESDALVGHVIAFDEYVLEGAPLVVAITRGVEGSFHDLKADGRVHTPIENEEEREEVSVIQHSLWIALGLLRGVPYRQEQFAHSLTAQLEEIRTQKYTDFPEPVKTQLTEGIRTFWDSFMEVGLNSGLIVHSSQRQ